MARWLPRCRPETVRDCVDPASYDIGNSTVASLAYDGLTAYRRGGRGGLDARRQPRHRDPGTGGRRAHVRLRAAARPPVLRRYRGRPRGLPQLDRADAADKRADVVRRLLPLPGHSRRPRLQRPVARLRSLDGIEVDPEERTITVHLTEPDDFPQRLALTVASVLPSESPMRFDKQATLPGTGPYRVASFDRDSGRIELVRTRVCRLVRGQDRTGSPTRSSSGSAPTPRPSSRGARRRDGPDGRLGHLRRPAAPERIARLGVRHADLLHTTALQQAEWMFLNVRRPPFDDARAGRSTTRSTGAGSSRSPAARSWRSQRPDPHPGLPGLRARLPARRRSTAAGIWTAPTSPKRSGWSRSPGPRDQRHGVDRHRGRARAGGSLLRLGCSTSSATGLTAPAFGNFEDRYYPAVADSRTGPRSASSAGASTISRRRTSSSPPSSAGVRAGRLGREQVPAAPRPADDAEIDAALAPSDADPASANATWAAVDRRLVDAARWSQCSTAAASRSSPNVQNVQLAPTGACYSTSSGSSSALVHQRDRPPGRALLTWSCMEWARSAPPQRTSSSLVRSRR